MLNLWLPVLITFRIFCLCRVTKSSTLFLVIAEKSLILKISVFKGNLWINAREDLAFDGKRLLGQKLRQSFDSVCYQSSSMFLNRIKASLWDLMLIKFWSPVERAELDITAFRDEMLMKLFTNSFCITSNFFHLRFDQTFLCITICFKKYDDITSSSENLQTKLYSWWLSQNVCEACGQMTSPTRHSRTVYQKLKL